MDSLGATFEGEISPASSSDALRMTILDFSTAGWMAEVEQRA